MIFVQGHVSEFVLFVKTRIFLSSGGCPIWGELSWEQHFILTCPMHHPCLAICKMNKLQEQDNCAKDPAASLIDECFHQHKLHCIRLTHCNNTNSETILSEIKVFGVKSFDFQLIKKHFRFLQLLCQRVKCMRLKKSDLFRILLLVALELSLHLFCSDLSYFFQKPEHKHFFFGQKKSGQNTTTPSNIHFLTLRKLDHNECCSEWLSEE